MSAGLLKANPMLAFGPGPVGKTCGDCALHFGLSCGKRISGQGRTYQQHPPSWSACKFFQVPCIRTER